MTKDLNTILIPINNELTFIQDDIFDSILSKVSLANEVSKYAIGSKGKRIRPAITLLCYKAISEELVTPEIQNLACAIELIHTATLLHDDVIDEAEVRRGQESVNKKWSDKVSILSGDFLLAQGLLKISSLKNLEIIELFSSSLIEICEGELFQISTLNTQPTIEQYIKKSEQKTAKLFVLAACTPAIFLNQSQEIIENFKNYGKNLGIAFQIINDLKDTNSIDEKQGILNAPQIIGVEKAKELACEYLSQAKDSLKAIPDSIYKESLISLCDISILH